MYRILIGEECYCHECGSKLVLVCSSGLIKRWWGKLAYAWTRDKEATWREYLAFKRWYTCHTENCPQQFVRIPLRKVEVDPDPVLVGGG